MAPGALTVSRVLSRAPVLLPAAAAARLDVELLLCRRLACPRSALHAHPGRRLTRPEWLGLRADLRRRRRGEPLAWLTGTRAFWTLELAVGPATLNPRPETELLVELALRHLRAGPRRVLDLGTGSGAVALAIGSERRDCAVLGSDDSAAALTFAARNGRQLRLRNVHWLRADWCRALAPGCWDVITSNPPYLAHDDRHLADDGLRMEPRHALVAGDGGLAALRVLAATAPPALAPGGWLLLEHGSAQGTAVRAELRGAGLAQVQTQRDLSGAERVTAARAPVAPPARPPHG